MWHGISAGMRIAVTEVKGKSVEMALCGSRLGGADGGDDFAGTRRGRRMPCQLEVQQAIHVPYGLPRRLLEEIPFCFCLWCLLY